jgi:NRAMP (natural resistance-associated macrophage protein)-like metal ion transporter
MSVIADGEGARSRPARLRRILGPGLIAGASDDDPSGIATYSQAGAQFGYGLLWTLIVTYPLMVAIQEISARLGHVSGHGIAANLQRHYPRGLARTLVALLALANIVNLGADIGAMGAAVQLLLGGPALLYVALFALVSVLLEVFTTYARYAAILKWLCLSLLSYVLCVFVVNVSWQEVGLTLVRPQLSAQRDYLMAVVAVFGTTISPYLFFWQAQQEVEERETHHTRAGAPAEFKRIRLDTLIGMALSNIIALCIIITAGATLHRHGLTTIESAAQAAEALRAVAGRFAFAIFALGIVGTGLLTVPVLAGSAAYAVGELLSWPVGLNRRPARARSFYTAVALATLLGCALNFSPINPIRALYWSAVLNGVVAVPVMLAMMHLSNRGGAPLPRGLAMLGWGATAGMTLAVLGFAYSAIR